MPQKMQNISTLMPEGVGGFLLGSVGSTNDEARSLIRQGQPLPFWVTAKEQVQGRGRRGRSWTGMAGNLFASLAITAPTALSGLPFVAALSVREAMLAVGVDADSVSCKWPNDVLIGGAKASGILIEAEAASADSGKGTVIIGTGVNLAVAPENTPYPATSVRDQTGKAIDPLEFLEYQAVAFKKHLDMLDARGLKHICDAWCAVATGIGETVEARMGEETISGIFKGIADDGALLLGVDGHMNAANERRLYAADIFPVVHKKS